jgi:hypothetical protein
MDRTTKTFTAASAMAIAALLAPGQAGAQNIGWNLIRPNGCFHSVAVNTSGQFVYTAYVYTSTFTVTLTDPVSIGAALQWCYNGSAFWGYYNGTPVWSDLYTTPGLK